MLSRKGLSGLFRSSSVLSQAALVSRTSSLFATINQNASFMRRSFCSRISPGEAAWNAIPDHLKEDLKEAAKRGDEEIYLNYLGRYLPDYGTLKSTASWLFACRSFGQSQGIVFVYPSSNNNNTNTT